MFPPNPPTPPTPPDPSEWILDHLEINPNSTREGRRNLTRIEVFVLGWFVFNNTGRSYANMARDCKLTIPECRTAVMALVQEDIIRLS
ncbi:MAG: hypothetical protein F6J93_11245 [Oscillatoria sp. SIO1A7]|nr:hypothetical protein [Oscillatoria sp. SIO1A7]